MSLKAEGICYIYEGMKMPALDAISLDIKKGELALVCGNNGSGKSTLLRCLAGLARPSSGHVTIDGKAAEQSRRKIGLAIQFPERALFERTAFDDVAFGPRNMGMPAGEVRRRVEAAIDAVGLGRALLEASPRSLSHGQKRLLAIASAIAHEPQYLFLDEPAAGLDYRGRMKIAGLIEELNRSGTTVVVASHDPSSLLDRCSRLIALEAGRVIVDAPPSFSSARQAGIRSETMELIEQLKGRGMSVKETFLPEVLAGSIAEAFK